jgi:cytoskeletal protein CcmA (bactofilin family)
MGIINRGHTPDRKRTGTTVIAAGTKLDGDLTLSDSLHVDGTVEGKIESDGEVSIGQEGRIDGEINAEAVMISGRFEGSISARRLEIVATGRVSGSVSVEQLVIESGASFNGTSSIREPEPPRQIGHEGSSSSNASNARKGSKSGAKPD